MTEQDQPTIIAERSDESDRILGPKSWTALIAIMLVLCSVAWIVVSVLTARPSMDPTVHTDVVALANSQQPDPTAPSRYADLAEALMDFNAAMDQVANEVVRAEGYSGSGVKMLDFTTVRFPPDPTDPDADKELADADDARRAVDVILERRLFDEVTRLLRSPNLGNGYPSAFDESGALLLTHEWLLPELGYWRKYANTVVGCARIMAERGETQRAASLLQYSDTIPPMLTRQATFVEHLIGLAIADLIATEIEFIATRPGITAQTLTTLRRSHEQLSDFGDLTVAIKGERVTMRDVLYRAHTAGGRYIPSIGEQITSFSWPREPIELADRFKDISGYLAPSRDANLKVTALLYQHYEAAAREPDPAERDRSYQAVDDSLNTLDERYEYLIQVFPILDSGIAAHWETRARITALSILLAMAEHRLDHADWPTSLDQLVPDYLDAIPVNPLTGDPFEYDHEPGQPPSLERFGVGI